MWTAVVVIIVSVFSAQSSPSERASVLSGSAAEEFLRSARITDMEAIPVGVTDPRRVRLDDGVRTAYAVFKTIDEYQPIRRFNDGGAPIVDFRDSYKSEVAAYELDKLLGLGMVPPTVERKVGRERGSLQLWIEDCMTEGKRRKRGVPPPDRGVWAHQMHNVRLVHQLVGDRDYRNASNLLVDPGFRIWIVDSSRAFPVRDRLLDPTALRRFSATLLVRLAGVTRENLEESVGAWLSSAQIDSLLVRRDRILLAARREVAARGEAAVLY